MPDENIKGQVVKMINYFCDIQQEIHEHFNPVMVDVIIPELCHNYQETLLNKDNNVVSFLKLRNINSF